MNRWKKILIGAGALLALFIVLLISLDILAPLIINLESSREKIRAYASREIGVEVDFARIEPSLFPRPGIVLDKATFRIPGTLEGAVRRITIKAKILPLIRGKIVLADLRIDQPVIPLRMKMQEGEAREKTKKVLLSGAKDLMRMFFLILSRGNQVKISEGKLSIVPDGRSVIEFAPLNADIASRGNMIELDIRTLSNVAQNIEISMRIDPEKQTIAGRVDLENVKLHEVAELLSPATAEYVSDTQVNLRFGLDMSERQIRLTDLEGSAGRTVVSGVDAQIDLQDGAPRLRCSSGTVDIAVDELLQRLTLAQSLTGGLKDIQSAAGNAVLTIRKIEGPMFRPSAWVFDISGELKDVAVNSPRLPGPVIMRTGTLLAAQDHIEFSNIQMDMIDTSLQVSGSVTRYRWKDRTARITVRGMIGSRTHKWINTVAGLPPRFYTEYPMIIEKANVDWKGGSHIVVMADVAVPEGPLVGIDLEYRKGDLEVKKFSVKDEHSDGIFTLRIGKDAIDMTFSGTISGGTVSQLLSFDSEGEEWLRGKIAIEVPRDRSSLLAAAGEFEGGNIRIPWAHAIPLEIDTIHVIARDRTVSVESSTVLVGDLSFQVRGSLGYKDNRYIVNGDIETKRLSWEAVRKIIGEKEKEATEKNQSTPEGIPIEGTINVRTDSFAYKDFHWEPLHLAISVDPEGITVKTTEAMICDVATPVTVRVKDTLLDVQARVSSKGQDVRGTVKCLYGKDADMTGTFELKGNISGKGTQDSLVQSLSGHVEFIARKGRIYRQVQLSRILQIINVTEVFRGNYANILEEGFAYESFVVKGNILSGKFVLDEMVLDGSTMEIVGEGEIDIVRDQVDMTVIAAPLKTVDAIVKKIPLLRDITHGTLITIAMKITGQVRDPEVKLLPSSAAGEGIVGAMKRVFKLPVQLISPDDAKPGNEKSD